MSSNDYDPKMHELLHDDAPELSRSFYDDLDAALTDEPTVIVPRKRNVYLRASAAVVAVAASLVVALLLTGLPSSDSNKGPQIAGPTSSVPDTSPPVTNFRPTLASQIYARSETQFSTIKTLTGLTTSTTPCLPDASCKTSTETSEFRFRSNGDLLRRIVRTDDSGRASNDTQTSFQSESTGISISETTSSYGNTYDKTTNAPVDPLPVIWGTESLSGLLNGQSVDQSSSVAEVEIDGRKAWRVDVKIKNDAANATVLYPDRVVADFDEETWLPVSIQEFSKSKVINTVKLTDLRINPPLTDADFDVPVPKGATVNTYDAGWKRYALDNTQPLPAQVPVHVTVPDEFVASSVVANAKAPVDEGPSPTNVVQYNFRSGLRKLTVEYADTPASEENQVDRTTTETSEVVIKNGAFAGKTAKLVTSPYQPPKLFIRNDKKLLRIQGDVTLAELTAVAESARTP